MANNTKFNDVLFSFISFFVDEILIREVGQKMLLCKGICICIQGTFKTYTNVLYKR